uniref:Uncharacterized protein n=1 Tax=Aegilops tauschii subsp. strangulata TaxID=200361 RepID=A0A453BJ54_AEGTS
SPWCPSSLRRRRIWTRSRESAASRAAARRPCGEDERAARRTCREHGRAAHRRPSHSPAEDGAQPPRRRTPPTCRPVVQTATASRRQVYCTEKRYRGMKQASRCARRPATALIVALTEHRGRLDRACPPPVDA